jgi:hypothetical protein
MRFVQNFVEGQTLPQKIKKFQEISRKLRTASVTPPSSQYIEDDALRFSLSILLRSSITHIKAIHKATS